MLPEPSGPNAATRIARRQPAPPTAPPERVYSLFQAATRLPLEEREAFLSEQTTADLALRREVEELLRQDAASEATDFLRMPLSWSQTSVPTGSASEPHLLGQRIGPFEVLSLVGSGGMGHVYRAARREHYAQDVALKVIRGLAAGDEALARFEAERQILADLPHPYIARLLGGATTADGLPYLVMELIEGSSITDFCDGQQWPLRARLELLCQVCQAVQFMHERGILHRDLKPANILVTAEGTPKLTDFGLARYLDQSSNQTRNGAILGTPSYMAPEQALGLADQLTAATDVYALGAILYELLTGRPPFKGSTWTETLEQVRSQEPLPPRRLQASLPCDVETICLTCLHKEPGRRYGSAAALADDLGRFLAGEPIEARPTGPVERFWRWCGRNPRVAGLSAALVLALLSGLGGITALWRLADGRANALAMHQRESDRLRERAEAKQALARRAVDDMYTWVGAHLLSGQPGMTQSQRAFLQKALVFYQQFAQEQGRDPEVRYKTSQAYYYVAAIQGRLGHLADAERAYRRQLALLQALAHEFPGNRDYGFDLFYAHLCLAPILYGLGHDNEASQMSEQALVEIRALVRAFPDEPNYRDCLACQAISVASHQMGLGHLRQGGRLLDEAIAIAAQLVRDYPVQHHSPYYALNLATALEHRALMLGRAGRFKQAEEDARRAVHLGQRLTEDHPEEPSLGHQFVFYQRDLATLLASAGRLEEAQHLLTQAIRREEPLCQAFPDVLAYAEGTTSLYGALGYVALMRGQPDAAARAFAQQRTWMEKLAARMPPAACYSYRLAWLLSTCPVASIRDPDHARALLARPAQTAPEQSCQQLARAAACYAARDWRGVLALIESIRSFPSSGYLQALCHDQLGQPDKAREAYAQARQRLAREGMNDLELLYLDRMTHARLYGLAGADTRSPGK